MWQVFELKSEPVAGCTRCKAAGRMIGMFRVLTNRDQLQSWDMKDKRNWRLLNVTTRHRATGGRATGCCCCCCCCGCWPLMLKRRWRRGMWRAITSIRHATLRDTFHLALTRSYSRHGQTAFRAHVAVAFITLSLCSFLKATNVCRSFHASRLGLRPGLAWHPRFPWLVRFL